MQVVVFLSDRMSTSTQSVRTATLNWLVSLIFTLAVLGAVLSVAFPIWVIRPFRYQGPLELITALSVLRFAPWVTLVDGLIVLVLTPILWRASRTMGFAWLWRTGLVVAVLLVGVSATVAHVNVFEHMFHPISSLRFLPVAQAKLAPDDMLMTVTIGGESHAYPIREMAYHHVVNDVVGDTPVAATY